MDVDEYGVRTAGLEEQRAAFRMTLEHYVPLTGYNIPGSVSVLNLGCGMCLEGSSLEAYFGGEGRNFRMVGIDNNGSDLRAARKLNPGKNFKFVRDDARRAKYATSGEGKFDVVVAKQPYVLGGEGKVWRDILKEARRVVRDDNLFVGTTISYGELDTLESFAKEAGYEILIRERNPYGIKRTTNLIVEGGHDYCVLFGKIPAKKE